MKEIKVYLEGGIPPQTDKFSDIKYRKAFDTLFRHLKDISSNAGNKLTFIPCGGKDDVDKKFDTAISKQDTSKAYLLRDTDAPVPDDVTPLNYLRSISKVKKCRFVTASDNQIHFMVQVMESWFFADIDLLRNQYNVKDDSNDPLRQYSSINNVEIIDKDEILDVLETISIRSGKKDGSYKQYGKRNQAVSILEKLNLDTVRQKATHCDRFCKAIESLIQDDNNNPTLIFSLE